MQFYKQNKESLHRLLELAASTGGATLLIPDLQRPYVWRPRQVSLLVDSLIRGWPFGTLLLWDVHESAVGTIPSRPFWNVVDRTQRQAGTAVSMGLPPADFRMVLDGQQRLQSILLAFGGDGFGFKLGDRDWADEFEVERPTGRHAAQRWSQAHLAFDLNSFSHQYATLGQNVLRVDYVEVLKWVVFNEATGRSRLGDLRRYKGPLPCAYREGEQGRFLRVSRLWDQAKSSLRFPKEYNTPVRELLARNQVDGALADAMVEPLSELVSILAGVKYSEVSFLELQRYEAGAVEREVYDDAIVNIFTRLNTAGRALTRQEITFAWVKTKWDITKTGGRDATDCFEQLQTELADHNLDLDMDTLVSLASVAWSVVHNEGRLLTPRDLLKGDRVGPLAGDLGAFWSEFTSSTSESAAALKDRDLFFRTHYQSLNALSILCCWRLLGVLWSASRRLSALEADAYQKALKEVFAKHCDRWLIVSQWAGRWGRSTEVTLASYASDLAKDHAALLQTGSSDEALRLLSARMEGWLGSLTREAITWIDDLGVDSRSQVRQYYLPLWLWHRLELRRWNSSKVTLRAQTGSAKSKANLDVDHVVAHAFWEDLAAALPAQEREAYLEVMAAEVNALGNCALLEKTFNISKGKKALGAFLSLVREFREGTRDLKEWAGSLSIAEPQLNADHRSLGDLQSAVAARTEQVKEALREYVRGNANRVDV